MTVQTSDRTNSRYNSIMCYARYAANMTCNRDLLLCAVVYVHKMWFECPSLSTIWFNVIRMKESFFLHRLNACILQQTMNKIALTFLNSEWVTLTRDFMKMTYCHFVFTVWTNVGTPQQRWKKITSDSFKKKIYYSKKKKT